MEPSETGALPDSVTATIRTAAQALAGVILYAIFNSPLGGLPLFESLTEGQLVTVLLPILTAAWTWGIGMLERHANPLFGLLFLLPKKPSYS